MKKFLILLLSLLLVLSFSACKNEEPIEKIEEEEIEGEVIEKPEEPSEEPEEIPEETIKTDVDLFAVLGETVGDTYYHADAGISVKIPDGWKASSPDELVTDGDKFAEVLYCEDQFYNTIMVILRKTTDYDTKEEIIEFSDTEWFHDDGIFLENKETGFLDIKDIYYSEHTYGGKVNTLANTYIVFMDGYIIEINCILSHNTTMDFMVSHIDFNAEEK